MPTDRLRKLKGTERIRISMGLAASQARLLSITRRISDNELRAQLINNQKMRLATESSKVSESYINALNSTNLMFSNYASDNSMQTIPLSFNALTSYNQYNNQYVLSDVAGSVFLREDEAKLFAQSNGDLNKYLSLHGIEYTTTFWDVAGANIMDDAAAVNEAAVIRAWYETRGIDAMSSVSGIEGCSMLPVLFSLAERIDEVSEFTTARREKLINIAVDRITDGLTNDNGEPCGYNGLSNKWFFPTVGDNWLTLPNNDPSADGSLYCCKDWFLNKFIDINKDTNISEFENVYKVLWNYGNNLPLGEPVPEPWSDIFADYKPVHTMGNSYYYFDQMTLDDLGGDTGRPENFAIGDNTDTTSMFYRETISDEEGTFENYYIKLPNPDNNDVWDWKLMRTVGTYTQEFGGEHIDQYKNGFEEQEIDGKSFIKCPEGQNGLTETLYVPIDGSGQDIYNANNCDVIYHNADKIANIHYVRIGQNSVPYSCEQAELGELGVDSGRPTSFNIGNSPSTSAMYYLGDITVYDEEHPAPENNPDLLSERKIYIKLPDPNEYDAWKWYEMGTVYEDSMEPNPPVISISYNNGFEEQEIDGKSFIKCEQNVNGLTTPFCVPINGTISGAYQTNFYTNDCDVIYHDFNKLSLLEDQRKQANRYIQDTIKKYLTSQLKAGNRIESAEQYDNFKGMGFTDEEIEIINNTHVDTELGDLVQEFFNIFLGTPNRALDDNYNGTVVQYMQDAENTVKTIDEIVQRLKQMQIQDLTSKVFDDGTINSEDILFGNVSDLADAYENVLEHIYATVINNDDSVIYNTDNPQIMSVRFKNYTTDGGDKIYGDITSPDNGTENNYWVNSDLKSELIYAAAMDFFNKHGMPVYGYMKNGEDATAEAEWYTNLFGKIEECGYKTLEKGLASSTEWMKYALENGIGLIEQLNTVNGWNKITYNSCSDITEETNSQKVTLAEAQYNKAMNQIQAKDERFDLELKNIDTEHASLQQEYESVKKAMEQNVQRTFKLYS